MVKKTNMQKEEVIHSLGRLNTTYSLMIVTKK